MVERQELIIKNPIKDILTYKKVQTENEVHMFQKIFTKAEIKTLQSKPKQITFNASFKNGVFAGTKNDFYVTCTSFINEAWPYFRSIGLEIQGSFHSKIKLIELRYTWLSLDMASDVFNDEGAIPRLIDVQLIANEQTLFAHSIRHRGGFNDSSPVFRCWIVAHALDEPSHAFLCNLNRIDCNFSKKHLRVSKLFDVDIVVNDEIFPAHRWILSERSPVFERMFEAEMAEINQIIKIDDSNSSVVKEFLEFLYTGSCESLENKTKPDVDALIEVFRIADKYRVEQLKYKCASKLKEAINVKNVVKIYTLAYLNNAKSLELKAKNFFEKRKHTIVPNLESVMELMKIYHPDAVYNLMLKENSNYVQELKTLCKEYLTSVSVFSLIGYLFNSSFITQSFKFTFDYILRRLAHILVSPLLFILSLEEN